MSPLAWLLAPLNALLSINRLGRGNAALFLLLSFGAIGTGISLPAHLLLGVNAALWYNGLNDLIDLEVDRAAYAGRAHRKVLLNGAMSTRALWGWLAVLGLASLVVLVRELGWNPWCLALFTAGIGCSVVYDYGSKHLAKPSIGKSVLLDALVGGPFYFHYASLAVASERPPEAVVIAATMGSLLVCGLYGNFIFAAKDLSTDAKSTKTLPMMLGSTVGDDGKVRHARAGNAYLGFWCVAAIALLAYTGWKGHWFAVPYAARWATVTMPFCAGEVTERGHKKRFIEMSNWEMAFLLAIHFTRLGTSQLVEVVVLGAAIILANVAYFHDAGAGRLLMLRLRFR